ncbi:MAG: hypothetical protein DKINENOH_01003 [bacterium]|nr:hypothetical protein [bacterium]
MEISAIYNRLIYRDILGYCLPGVVLISSALLAVSPISINGRTINLLEPLSTSKLIALLGLGFVIGHLVAVLPRKYLRAENNIAQRSRRLERAYANFRIKAIEPILIEAFENVFGEGTWSKLDYLRKGQLVYRWIRAKNLHTDTYNRIESIRIFFENVTFSLPLTLFILATHVTIANLSNEISTSVLVILGIVFMILSIWGSRGLEMMEEREVIYIFIDYYLHDKEKVHVEYEMSEKRAQSIG